MGSPNTVEYRATLDVKGIQAGAAEAVKAMASINGEGTVESLKALNTEAARLGSNFQAGTNQASSGMERLSKSSTEAGKAQATANVAGEHFLATLREQIAVSGKSTEELLRYKAAQSGVAAEAAPLILQLQNQRAAQEAATAAARQEEAALREVSAAKQRATAAQDAFMASLREQIAVSGKSTEELLRYRAAQAGAAADAAPLILQLQNQRAAQEAATAAARQEETALREATAAKQRATAAQEAFMAGLREQIALQGKSTAEVLHYRAAQLGISGEASQYINQISEANKKGAISAGQHAAAMRMLPAQMTDVVTSVASGMPIWMVAIQQGGQIKDSFGGAGAAAKAMLGAITPLTAGLAAGAVVVGTAAAAYYQGSAEADGFRKALTMTGNTAGVTVSQLSEISKAVGNVVGGQHSASQALTQLAGTGAIAGESLQQFTTVAMNLERYAGQPVKKTAEDLAKLGDEPVKASIQLNAQYHYLTESVYRHIKALEDQGRKDDAAALAQKTYADAMAERTGTMKSSLGTLERAWETLGNIASKTWNAMLNVGRAATLEDIRGKIAKTNDELNGLLAGDGFSSTAGGAALGGGANARARRIEQLRHQLGELQAAAAPMEVEDAQAAIKAEQQANEDAKITARQRTDALRKETRSRKAIRDEEIEQLNRDRSTLAMGQEEYDKLLAGIKEKYKDPKKSSTGGISISDNQVAGLQSQLQAAQQYYQQLQALGSSASELNAGERESLKLSQQITLATNAKTRAKLEEAKAIADALGVQLRSNDGLEKSYKAQQALIDGNYKDAEALKQRSREQEAANAVFGKGRTAIEKMTLATLEHQMAEAEGSDRFDPKYIASLEEKIAAQKDWVEVLGQADYKAVMAHADELLRNAQELSKVYADEMALSGLTGLEREKIVAARQVELKYAKELDAVNKGTLGDTEKQAALEKINEARAIESAAAVAKAQQNYMAKADEEINKSLTDALLRGFESGKTAAENLADTVENMFKTMVLRPVISAVMAPVSGVINGVVQSGLNALGLGGGSNVLGLASNASSLYSLTTGNSLMGNVASTVGGWLGLGGAAATGLGMTAASAGAGAIGAGIGSSLGLGAAGAAGTGLGLSAGATGLGLTAGSAGSGAIGAGLGTSAAATTGAASATSMLAAIPGWGWALAGGAMLLSQMDFGSRGANHSGGVFSTATSDRNTAAASLGVWGDALGDFTHRGNASIDTQLAQTVNGLMGVYQGLASYAGTTAKTLDLAAGFAANGVHSDEDAYAYFKLRDKTTGAELASYSQRDGGLGSDVSAAWSKYVGDMAGALVGQIKQSDIPGWMRNQLDSLVSDITVDGLNAVLQQIAVIDNGFKSLGSNMSMFAGLSGDMQTRLINASGGFEALATNAGTFFQGFYSEGERMGILSGQVRDALAGLNISIDPDAGATAKAEYRALVESTMAGGNAELEAQLLALSGSFEAAATYAQKTADATGTVATELADLGVVLSDTMLSLLADRKSLAAELLRAQGDNEGYAAAQRAIAIEGYTDAEIAAYDYNAALRAQIDALDAARAAATAASEAETQRVAAVAQERSGLERQLLESMGDTVAIRALERAVLDETNRALYDRINAISDEKAAAARATEQQQAAKDAALSNLKAAIDSEKSYWTEFASASQSAIGALTSTLNTLRSNAQSLYGDVQSTAQMQSAAAMLYIEESLAAVQSGAKVQSFDYLADAISSARSGISSGAYVSAKDREFDALALAGQLKSLGALTEDQLTVEERALKAAQAQVDRLDDIRRTYIDGVDRQVDAVLSVEEAVRQVVSLQSSANAMTAAAAAQTAAALAAASGGSAFVSSPVNENGSHTGIGDSGYVLSGNTLYFPGGGSHSVEGSNAAQILMETYGLTAGGANGTLIRTRAQGGYTPPGWTLVGEEGPEIVNFREPSMIYTAAQSANLFGGSGNNSLLEKLMGGMLREFAWLNQQIVALSKDQRRCREVLEAAVRGELSFSVEAA